MPANVIGRSVVVPLTNKSGGQVIAGDVVILDAANNDAFTTTTSGGISSAGIGIAQETIASNATGRVLTHGYASLVNVNASVTRGNFGKTHTVAKQATDAGSSRTAGTFCFFLTGGTTPDAIVWQPDLGGASMTNPMTTTGDIIYSSDNSGTPARLAKGAAGGYLSMINGALAWNSGTSNPGSAVAGDRYWRTDLGMAIYYDGTRWLSMNLYTSDIDSGAFIQAGITTSGTSIGRITPFHTTYDLYLVAMYTSLYVTTTNTGSAYWTLTLTKYQNDLSTNSTVASVNTSANAANVVVTSETSIGALFTPATYKIMQVAATKTGSPGLLQAPPFRLTYRLVIT